MHSRFFPTLLASLLLAASLPAQTAPATPPATITTGVGFDFSRGDYGLGTDTDVLSVPVSLAYERGPWTFEARLPWLRVDGPAAVVAGGGGPTRPTSAAESGLGDLTLSATRRFNPVAGGLVVAATARAKLPTASDARGLGTGEADYYGQLDFYESFGTVTPFVSLGYAVLGDNAAYQLEDGPYVSTGAHFRVDDRTVVSAALDWRHRFIAGGDPGADAMLAVTHDFSPRWRVMAYALKGFTDASPDFGGGVQASCRF